VIIADQAKLLTCKIGIIVFASWMLGVSEKALGQKGRESVVTLLMKIK
jgi:hypothetical protein